MGSIREDNLNVGRVAERDEAKASAATWLAVLHDDAINHLAVAAEVALQVLLRCLPWQTTNKQFSVINKQTNTNVNKLEKIKNADGRKKMRLSPGA